MLLKKKTILKYITGDVEIYSDAENSDEKNSGEENYSKEQMSFYLLFITQTKETYTEICIVQFLKNNVQNIN